MVTLEKIIGSERVERIRDNPVYQYAVDTAAMITFSTPIAMANEIFIADMSVEQSLKARGIATVVNMLTARLYGTFRDYIFKKCRTTEESGFIKKTATDILAFAAFQAPLYAGILAVSGAKPEKVLVGSAVITGISGFIGRPYGAYLDVVRKFCGLKPAYALAEESRKVETYNSTNTPTPQ